MALLSDRRYLAHVMGNVGDRVLEIGSRDVHDGDPGLGPSIVETGRAWEGCDIQDGANVDFTLDILDDAQVAAIERRWSTVLMFNLLEHLYDPSAALRNAVSLVEPGGTCVVLGPAVWQLHDFPRDCWRPLPDFFLLFAERHHMEVVESGFCWVLEEHPWLPWRDVTTRIVPVAALTVDGQKLLPGRHTATAVWGARRAVPSIVLQRVLNLTGRVWQFPTVALGVVLRKR